MIKQKEIKKTLKSPFIMLLEKEIDWIEKCITVRMASADSALPLQDVELPPAPKLPNEDHLYIEFIKHHQLSDEERLILLLSLLPHIKPSSFSYFLEEGDTKKSGLITSSTKAQLLPTAETALFLVSGSDLSKRLAIAELFDSNHVFFKKGVLDILSKNDSGSQYDGELKMNQDYVESFLYNKVRRPRYSSDFPAHLLETKLTWDDLVLNPSTDEKLAELKDALLYKDQLSEEWGLGAHLKPGYRAIFYGPSGTGKSLTATLLGKMLDRDVYRVDLSAIISKYIGETEENLRKLLSKSEDKGYILFFDEGDALFGSRSDDVQNSNDQHQNQLIAYLLQAIENFNGIIILATNMKHNMDSAFSRRFQSSIFFGPPKPEQGLELWTRLWPQQLKKEPSLDFKLLASSKPFTAATIVQIVHNLALQAIRKNKYSVGMADIKRIVEELQRK